MTDTTEITKIEQQPPAPQSNAASAFMTIMTANPTADPEWMKQVFGFWKEAQAYEAMQAFNRANADMQAELPMIKQGGSMNRGAGGTQKFARYEDVLRDIRPILANHGFALSFQPEVLDNGKRVKVTGTLSHREGHFITSNLELPADISGGKNAVQALGSSVSYAKRYLTTSMLNLATSGEDDDGEAAGAPTKNVITDAQEEELRNMITKHNKEYPDHQVSITGMLQYFRIETLSDLPANQFERAEGVLSKAIEQKIKKKNAEDAANEADA